MSGTVVMTGGSGFIGSHTLIELINANYECIVIDNLSNSKKEVIKKCEIITGKQIKFECIDLLDYEKLCDFFQKYKIDVVIHLASFKSVNESVQQPLKYYHNNIVGSINLFRAMQKYKVQNLVFSSSATVYGTPQYLPIDENHPTGNCCNSYGFSKVFIEKIIEDHFISINANFIVLRYFNPVGAHKSGLIGESPNGIPQNLFPYVELVAVEKMPYLNVYGNDYDTIDGTGVRDYVHVVDIATAHVRSVDRLLNSKETIQKIYNLGTGNGFSVLQVVNTYQKVCGKKINIEIKDRRPGDLSSSYSDYKLAIQELNWNPQYNLEAMCEDSWRWIQNNH